MGSACDRYDNAPCESFFATLECELNERSTFDFIEGFYNRKRRHSSIGHVSRAAFERAGEQEAA